MMLSVPTSFTSVKLSKMEYRTRYDVPGYETGGLPYGYLSTKGDGYLVSTAEGKVLGGVYKWSDGKWTSFKLAKDVTLDEGHAFSCYLYTGKTRAEAVGKLVSYTK